MAESTGKAVVVGSRKLLSELLTETQGSLAAVLPKHLSADRLVKLALLASIKTPRLLECTKESIIDSLMNAAQLGLEPNGVLGSGYLVPFNNRRKGAYECQFIPGYRGLIDLARRSGDVVGAEARVVYQGDVFDVDYGTEAKIIHKPNFSGDRSYKAIIAFYMVAQLNDSVKQFEVMTKIEVDAIRARSRSANDGPWVTDYEEMGKKTVVKRGAKYLPLSASLAAAIEYDNRIESGEIGGINLDTDTEEGIAQHVADRTKEKIDDLKTKMKVTATADATACSVCGRTDGTHDAEKPCFAD